MVSGHFNRAAQKKLKHGKLALTLIRAADQLHYFQSRTIYSGPWSRKVEHPRLCEFLIAGVLMLK